MLLKPRKSVISGANERSLLYAALFLFCAILNALFSSPAEADTRKVTGLEFSEVVVFGDIEVEISQGEENRLLLRGDTEGLDMEPFVVQDDMLILGRSRKDGKRRFQDLKYRLTVDDIKRVALKGSGDIYVRPMDVEQMRVSIEGTGDIRLFDLKTSSARLEIKGTGDIQVAEIETEVLDLAIAGTGDIHLKHLRAERIEASIAGSGDIRAHKPAEVEDLQINIVGAGDVNFRKVASEVAQVNIVGSGDAHIGESETLQVAIMGGGDVHYRGEPEISENILGSGSLRPRR